jgi:transposase InsO family protein
MEIFYLEGFVLYLPGRLIGKLFLFICKLYHSYHRMKRQSLPPEIFFLEEEIIRLRTANSIMKQCIRRKRFKPPLLTKCRMVLFAFRFNVPHRRIHLYLPISKSTILRYISMVKKNFFGLLFKRSRFFLPVNKTPKNIELLVWKIKEENSSWGYLRIALHLWRLLVFLSLSTVRRILLKPRPEPIQQRKGGSDGKEFKSIVAIRPNALWSLDLTTLRVSGIFKVYVLGIIDHYSRKVFCLSSAFHPTAEWIVYELKKVCGVFGVPKRIIADNGGQFISTVFKELMTTCGINHVRTSVGHPQTNGKIERFFQSLKYEFMSLFFLRSKGHLDGLLAEYLLYYNEFRLHEAIDGQTPNAVHYDKQTEKPDKSSKQIRAPIEEIRMGNGHLKAYRLKEAA